MLLAKQIPGVPIKTIWSREEDMRQGRFRPIAQCKMAARTRRQRQAGRPSDAHIRRSRSWPSSFRRGWPGRQGLRQPPGPQCAAAPKAQFGYTIPNLLIEHAMRNTHVPPGFWRGVNTNQNAVYLECFMDEIAKAAGKDPLEFRRALMANHPKHLAVLNAVADKIGWDKPPPAGVFRGIAQFMGYGSYSRPPRRCRSASAASSRCIAW